MDNQQQQYKPAQAVQVAKTRAKTRADQKIIRLSTGYRARITPVSPGLLNQVQMSVQMPAVPTWYNDSKGKNEENPNDPRYLQQIERAEADRVMAALDAIVLFGVDIVDDEGNDVDAPDNDGWLTKLLRLASRGLLDLSEFDLDDSMDRSFIFKKYVAIGTNDMRRIAELSGLDADAEVEQAVTDSFQAD